MVATKPSQMAGGLQIGTPTLEDCLALSVRTNSMYTQRSVVLFLARQPTEVRIRTHRNVGTRMYIASSVMISLYWKQPNVHVQCRRINKCGVSIMDYCILMGTKGPHYTQQHGGHALPKTMLRKRSQPLQSRHGPTPLQTRALQSSLANQIAPFSGNRTASSTWRLWGMAKFSFLIWVLDIYVYSLTENLSSCALRICVFFCIYMSVCKNTICSNNTNKIKLINSLKPRINWVILRHFFALTNCSSFLTFMAKRHSNCILRYWHFHF